MAMRQHLDNSSVEAGPYRFTFWVSAEAAAVLADLLAFGSRMTFAAALAALALVASLLLLCVSAEAAAVLAFLLALGSFNTFAAADAALLPVLSLFLAMSISKFPGVNAPPREETSVCGFDFARYDPPKHFS